MKANELRIGNYIDYLGGIERVHALSFQDVCTNNHNYKPTPLTEEWLLKFGFEKDCLMSKCYALKDIEISEDKNNDLYLSLDGVWYGVAIKHVHQLQNLYFALTGKELSLKH